MIAVALVAGCSVSEQGGFGDKSGPSPSPGAGAREAGPGSGGGGGADAADGGTDANNQGSPGTPYNPTNPANPGTPDAGSDADSGPWAEATHPASPQVQNNPGQTGSGPVLAAPVFTAISFPGYDLAADAERFVSTVGTIPYWNAAVGSYGVGAPVVNAPVHISQSPPATLSDDDIRVWLTNELTQTSDLPPATENSLYILFFPSSVTLTAFGETSCSEGGFNGYHLSTKVSGIDVAFVVLPECGADAPTRLTTTTLATSHEIAEAVTDPHPESLPTTWQGIDQDHIVWELARGGNGEVGDMCAGAPGATFIPAGLGYSVQRIWSNASAAAGHDPCQPMRPDEPVYFNAAPVPSDRVSIGGGQSAELTTGVRIAPGTTGIVEVDLFSDGPSAPWTVTAEDLSPAGDRLTFTWVEGNGTSATGQNGDKLHLAIHFAAGDAACGGAVFRITSRLGSSVNQWFGYVAPE